MITRIKLLPALITRSQTSIQAIIGIQLNTAPVTVLIYAILWLETLALWFKRRAGLDADTGVTGCDIGDWWPELWIWEFLVIVDVEGRSRVVWLDIAWDLDGLGWSAGCVGVEEDLSAAGVELWLTSRVVVVRERLMQREKFWADEVITTGEVDWEVDRKKTTGVNELLCAPFVGLVVVAIFVDFEPAVAVAWVFDGGVNFLHVDRTWSLVGDVDRTFVWLICGPAPDKG